jgi:acyl carrier protein
MSSDTYSQVVNLLKDKFHGSTAVTPETAITELGLDSLTLMEFVFAIEDAFNIRIPEEKIDPRKGTTTLAQVCTIIDEIKNQSNK